MLAAVHAEMCEGGVWGRSWLVGDAIVAVAPLRSYAPSAAGYNGVTFAFCLVLITPLTSSSVLGSLSRVLIAVAMTLDADSRKLCGELESLGRCSSVLAALGTIQLQGTRLSKSPRSFLESASNLLCRSVYYPCVLFFSSQDDGDSPQPDNDGG